LVLLPPWGKVGKGVIDKEKEERLPEIISIKIEKNTLLEVMFVVKLVKKEAGIIPTSS
jgi:hypothetical protein